MRSAALFLALLAAGVLIVLVYLWSGESTPVLVLSIVTLFAVLALIEWRPWKVSLKPGVARPPARSRRAERRRAAAAEAEADADVEVAPRGEPMRTVSGRSDRAAGRQGRGGFGSRDRGRGEPEPVRTPVWRAKFDITTDERGVSGVPVGERTPQLWAWSQIDDIGADRCEEVAGTKPVSKLGLRLDFPNLRNPEEPAVAMVAFGPHQTPDEVVVDVRRAWRESKIPRSRLHDMSSEERTRLMADHFGADDLSSEVGLVSDDVGVMYDTVRAILLASDALRRIDAQLSPDELLDAYDRLLRANRVEGLTEEEADELLVDVTTQSGFELVEATHRSFDWLAEERGRRVAFVDDGGEDYLMGLVPAESADDWDGQTVGDGAGRITLDPPT